MSTLKDFIHHELDAMPGPVPEPPVPPAAPAPAFGAAGASTKAAEARANVPQKAAGAVKPNAAAAKGRAEGALKGELYYTQAEAHPSVEGWVESDSTVDSKLCSKEEFPQG